MVLCKYCEIDKDKELFYSYRPKKCKECCNNNSKKCNKKYSELSQEQKDKKKQLQKKYYQKQTITEQL
jgi:hypothetical protein